MPYEKNMVIVYYEFKKYMPENAHICVAPMLRRLPKTQEPVRGQLPETGQYSLFTQTNGEFKMISVSWSDTLYFSKDACDERNADDVSALNVDNKVWQMKADEIVRQKALEENSGRTLPNAKMLARQSQVYVVQCDSTNKKSVIAGYPFFCDWSRDTLQPDIGVVTVVCHSG